MAVTHLATTDGLTIETVIDRLAQQELVDGLILVGSAAKAELTPASDYDLVLVLATLPVPLQTGVTSIDGRFTDLLFHTSAQVEQILAAGAPFDFWDWTGRLVGWLALGQVRFDRHGNLGAAQRKVQRGQWIAAVNDGAAQGAWQRINYNLAVVRRYLSADDPLYLATADPRMAIFGAQELFWHYFTVRGLPPNGEKQQIAYLQEHDPRFLAEIQRFLAEPNRDLKFRLYEALAAHVLAPVGRLWQQGETILNLTGPTITEAIEEEAHALWATLTRGKLCL